MSEAAWLAEAPLHGWQQRIQILDRLFEARSQYQQVEVWETMPFGRTLVLDGSVQTTEQDEFVYHEMLAHIPLMAHPRPERVLIVGGGDGGCLRRVLEHPVREVVQVEIDEVVVDACRRLLPTISAGAYDDPRAKLVIGDGLAYLERRGDPFDVILVDSTDPVKAASPLFSQRFYRAVLARLNPDGLLVTQSGSPLLMLDELRRVVCRLESVFGWARVYLAHIPSYPGVVWSFTLTGRTPGPLTLSEGWLERRLGAQPVKSRYYQPALQRAAFTLPAYLEHLLESSAADGLEAPIRSVPGQPPLD